MQKPLVVDLTASLTTTLYSQLFHREFQLPLPLLQGIHEKQAENNKSNIEVNFFSNLPGVQLYSAQNLNYKKKLFPYQGICLETQYFPDTPNKKNFPSTLIKPNKKYTCFTKIKIT